jgi:hypothetical protein
MLRRCKDMDEARKMMGPSSCSAARAARGDRARRGLSGQRRLGFMTGSDLLIDGGYTAI